MNSDASVEGRTTGVFDLHQIDNFAFDAIERYKRAIMEQFDMLTEAEALEKVKNLVSLMQGKLEKYFWDLQNIEPRHEIMAVVVDNCNFYDIRDELTQKEELLLSDKRLIRKEYEIACACYDILIKPIVSVPTMRRNSRLRPSPKNVLADAKQGADIRQREHHVRNDAVKRTQE